MGKEPPADGGAAEVPAEIGPAVKVTEVGGIGQSEEQSARGDCTELAPETVVDGLENAIGRPGEEQGAASVTGEGDEGREARGQREIDAGHTDRHSAEGHAAPHAIGQERYREPTGH